MRLDDKQAKAVETVGTNILVSASAGAGKTGVLVSRLIKRCLVDKVSLDEILAVTFTAAAAGEMKNRVASRLQEEYQKEDSDKEWIEEQMVLLATANITTIDAFCKTIIEKYYNVIGLDPAMPKNIVDSGRQQLLFDESLQHAIKDMDSINHDDLLKLLEYISPRSEDYSTLSTIVNKVMLVSEGTGNADEWLDQAYNNLDPTVCMHDETIRNNFSEHIRIKLLAVKNSLSVMHSLALMDEKLAKDIGQITLAQDKLESLFETLEEGNYEFFVDRLITYSLDTKTPSNGKNEPYKKARKAYTDSLTSLSKVIYDLNTYKEDSKDIMPIASTLISLVRLTSNYFKEAKKKEACMDFSDMESYAYDILVKDDYAISKIYQSTFKEVMVDEFQDTSTLQNEIIKLIAKPGTIFRVGDVKQSIYRFRQAKPDLMRSLFHEDDEEVIVLEHNYRSKNNIVDFCNTLFKRIMNVDGCKDRYDEKDTVSVGTDSQKLLEPDPIKFILTDEEVENKKDRKYTPKQAKAFYIASEIQRLHTEKNIPFKNFAVLVRGHQDKSILRYAFDTFNIPYDIDAREGFFKTSLCQTILSLLKVILDHNNTLALLAVVHSKLYDLSDTDLANLKIQYGSFYKGIKESRPDIFIDLENFKRIADKDGLTALLNAISVKNDFYNRISSKDQANFDFLYEKTITLEQRTHSIYDLLDFMQSSEDEKSTEAMSRNRDDDVVTVTTIHQSKGLQYKVVFLWGTSANKMMDFSSPILVDEALGLGFKHLDMPYRTERPTMVRLAIEHRENIEDLEETTRLLYVALTRAEEKMYIVDSADKAVSYVEHFNLAVLNNRKGMSGLILAALNDIPNLFEKEYVLVNNLNIPTKITVESHEELPTFNLNVEIHPNSIRPSEKEYSRLPKLTSRISGGKSHGTTMHAILEDLPNRVWSLEDLDSYPINDKAKEHILNFGNSDVYQEALTMEIYKEYPFFVKDKDTYIQGVIDFLAISDTDIILIDFKTDSASIEDIAEMYHDQLMTYTHALNLLYPEKTVHTYIYSLSHDKNIPVE